MNSKLCLSQYMFEYPVLVVRMRDRSDVTTDCEICKCCWVSLRASFEVVDMNVVFQARLLLSLLCLPKSVECGD